MTSSTSSPPCGHMSVERKVVFRRQHALQTGRRSCEATLFTQNTDVLLRELEYLLIPIGSSLDMCVRSLLCTAPHCKQVGNDYPSWYRLLKLLLKYGCRKFDYSLDCITAANTTPRHSPGSPAPVAPPPPHADCRTLHESTTRVGLNGASSDGRRRCSDRGDGPCAGGPA